MRRVLFAICAAASLAGCRDSSVIQATYCLIRTPMSAATQNRYVVTSHGSAYMSIEGSRWFNGDYELTAHDLEITQLRTAIGMMDWEETPTRYLPICVDQIAPGNVWSAPRQMGRPWWE